MKKYEKIYDIDFKKFVENSIVKSNGCEWYITEKIDGSNISMLYDIENKSYTFRSRNQEIDLNADVVHYNIHKNLEYLMRISENAVKYILDNFDVNTDIILFGEYCGGNYENIINKDAIPVNSTIMYGPDNYWALFDIAIDDSYISYNKLYEVLNFLKSEIEYNEFPDVLFKGSLEDCLKFDIKIDSTIPSKIGLEHLNKNTIEGVVIKRTDSRTIHDRRNPELEYYKVFKMKNDDFKERRSRNTNKTVYEYSDEENLILNEMSDMVTESRVTNIMKKFDLNDMKHFGDIIKETISDIIDEINDSEYKDIFESLDRKKRNMVFKRINAQIAKTIKDVF